MNTNTHTHTAWSDTVTPEYWIAQRYVADAGQYQIEAYVKEVRPRGIRQLLCWCGQYNEEQLRRDVPVLGTFSPRPYRIGQGSDGTTGSCILASFYQFCVSASLDPVALYLQAYPGGLEADHHLHTTRQIAAWQGVIYPASWGEQEIRRLLRDLSSSNNHRLATLVWEEAQPRLAGGFTPMRKSREGR